MKLEMEIESDFFFVIDDRYAIWMEKEFLMVLREWDAGL